MKQKYALRYGFTLIELLVVIAVMAALLAVALPNYLGARERARDVKLKSELLAVKHSLRMYYNDYQHYPSIDTDGGWPFKGCGSAGDTICYTTSYSCAGFWFAAGGSDSCSTIYMKNPLTINSFNGTLRYYTKDTNDAFMLCVDKLENASDPEIVESQKCYADGSGFATPTETQNGPYCICSD